MFNELNTKEKKNVLQTIKTLKLYSSPQGTLFIFLVTLLILENLEKEETNELLNVIVFNKDADCFEEENRMYLILFYFLLSKIKLIDSRKRDILISNLIEIPHFLKKITVDENILLKDLENFISKKNLIANKIEKEEKLHKMWASNIACMSLKKTKKKVPNTIKEKKNNIKDKK